LDSSTVAAVARRVLGDDDRSRLQAYSVVYDKLIPDQERQFAGLVADFCSIPIHYLVADGYQLFGHWRNCGPGPAEPQDQALFAINQDLYAQIAAQSRVVLTGDGGDPCLLPSAAAVVNLLRAGELWDVASAYLRCALWQRSVPRVGLRSLIRTRTNTNGESFVPEWINPELALKLDLSQRWRELHHQLNPINHHRPEAYKSVADCRWADNFELYDPGNTSWPVEARHPLFDIRLVDFMLSLPSLPWCIGKQIIREAMMGSLPLEVLRRRKTPLAGDPVVELLKQPQSSWIDSFDPAPELLYYVERSRIPSLAGKLNSVRDAWSNLRPLSLDHWLRLHASVEYKDGRKGFRGSASQDKSVRSP
jgi:asparagine synthase (glutamine-hydrolysing)